MALVVASIDFGTTFSGWAFSFKHHYDKDPTDVKTKHWHEVSYSPSKAPTSVLITADGKKVEAFGFAAENRYAELAEEGRHKEWFFFTKFKMKLYKSEGIIGKHMQLEDETGKKLKALTVFSLTIKYLHDDLWARMNRQVSGDVQNDEVHWVVTVPAIWDEDAKQFMIIAAIEAGIDVARLSLALEPEAASIYCRHVEMTRTENSSGTNISTFQPGTRYIVCDAGGGTVDMTVHEVTPDLKLTEIEKASGGDWGGTKVDEEFVRFINTLTGDDVVQALKDKHMDDYLELMRTFEKVKRDFKQSSSKTIRFRFPPTFFSCVLDVTRKKFMEHVESSFYKKQLRVYLDKIIFDASIISGWFAAPVKCIIKQLITILEKYNDNPINHIVMVGGFSESEILQDAVISAFPGKHVIIPEDAGLVVMKGAVVFGHNKRQIVSRIARYTYGISCWHTYDASIHPANKIVQEGTQKGKVDHGFSKLVEIGQSIKTDEPAGSGSYHAIDGHTVYAANVYATKAKNPVFVHDNGCFKIGSFVVNCKDKNGEKSSTVLKMYFGGTKLDCNVSLKTTGEEIVATFDLTD